MCQLATVNPDPNIDIIFLCKYAQLNPSGISAGEPSVYKYKGGLKSQSLKRALDGAAMNAAIIAEISMHACFF